MKIIVNGKETETNAANVAELSQQLQLPAKGVAVAVNNKMVPRTVWEETSLNEGAQVVIIKAACGG